MAFALRVKRARRGGRRKAKGPAYPIVHQHFVSDHPDIVEAFRTEHNGEPPTIASEHCPGFRLGGSFFYYLGGQPGSEYGDVSIVSRDGERLSERSYPQYPCLHLCIFPDGDDGLETLSWETLESQLPVLVKESVRTGLKHYRPATKEYGFVANLARQLLLKDKDSQFKALLEATPLFQSALDDQWPQSYLSLNELRNAKKIELIDSESQVSKQEEIVYFFDSWEMRQICKHYELPYSSTKKAMPVPKPDPEEVLMSRAVELNFGAPRRKGELYTVSNHAGQELVIDCLNRTLRVSAQDQVLEFDIDKLKVTRKDREMDSDTKTHHYCYIFFKQGEKSASVYQRYKDYYEGGRLQAELDKSQDSARAILNRVARALKSGDLSIL